jgi:hypothetical protein
MEEAHSLNSLCTGINPGEYRNYWWCNHFAAPRSKNRDTIPRSGDIKTSPRPSPKGEGAKRIRNTNIGGVEHRLYSFFGQTRNEAASRYEISEQ